MIVPATSCVIAVLVFNTELLIGEAHFTTWLVCFMYGISVIPFTYILSLVFKNTGTSQGLMLLLYFTASVIAS